MVPTGEGFHPDNAPRAQVDHRLQVGNDLAPPETGGEFDRHPAPVTGCSWLQDRCLAHHPSALALRVVHLRVGCRQQPGHRSCRIRQCDTHTGTDLHRSDIEQIGLAEHGLDPVGKIARRLPFTHVRGQRHELVTAHACNDITGPDQSAQPLGDLTKDRVARFVAIEVVDRLEPIEIDEQHCHGRVVGEQARQALQQEAAVGEAGQSVVPGDELQLVAHVLELGDVVPGADDAVDDRIGELIDEVEPDRARRAVSSAHRQLRR